MVTSTVAQLERNLQVVSDERGRQVLRLLIIRKVAQAFVDKLTERKKMDFEIEWT